MQGRNRFGLTGWILAFSLVSSVGVAGDVASSSPPRAARSVHLHYPAPEASLFYNEVTVEQSQRATYFCACGFSHGYFGMQELKDGKKVVIFSVWDPGEQQKASDVPAEQRVEMLFQGEGVRIGRFGGEGTGGQSFFNYDWKIGQTCKFLVRATVEGEKTSYAGYFSADGTDGWKHLVTFRTRTKGEGLKGLYSFVEDFRRDGTSPNERRLARYSNGWAQTMKGDWVKLVRAKFTGDNTKLDNVDAAVAGEGFTLATGGETTNHMPIGTTMERPPGESKAPDVARATTQPAK